MTNTDRAIINYVNSSMEYAILLDGEWGSGKTWYVKNRLQELLTDEEKKEIVYISLYGIESVEDLSKTLRYRLLLGDTNKNIIESTKMLVDLASEALNGYINKKTDSDINLVNRLKNVLNGNEALIKPKHVFVFDDLERVSESLGVKKVLGFISANLIESNNARVIFIANEKELKDISYQTIKEKTIGLNLKYEFQLYEIVNALYNEEIHSLSQYTSLEKDLIINFLEKLKIKNVRTIKVFLEYLKRLRYLSNYSYKEMRIILWSLLAIVNEYKRGKIQTDSFPDFMKENPNEYTYFKTARKGYDLEGNEVDISEVDEERLAFQKKYIDKKNSEYFYFSSIEKLVLKGFFDKELFLLELSNMRQYFSERETKPSKKDFGSFMSLVYVEDEEVIPLSRRLISHIQNEEYDLFELIRILKQYDNSINKDEIDFGISWSNISSLIKKCLESSISKTKYNEDKLRRSYLGDDISNMSPEFHEIHIEALKLEILLKEELEESKNNEIYNNLKNGELKPHETQTLLQRLNDDDISVICDAFNSGSKCRENIYYEFNDNLRPGFDYSIERLNELKQQLVDSTTKGSNSRAIAKNDIVPLIERLIEQSPSIRDRSDAIADPAGGTTRRPER